MSNHKTGGFLENRMTPNCRCRGKGFEASPRFKPPHQTVNGWEKSTGQSHVFNVSHQIWVINPAHFTNEPAAVVRKP